MVLRISPGRLRKWRAWSSLGFLGIGLDNAAVLRPMLVVAVDFAAVALLLLLFPDDREESEVS